MPAHPNQFPNLLEEGQQLPHPMVYMHYQAPPPQQPNYYPPNGQFVFPDRMMRPEDNYYPESFEDVQARLGRCLRKEEHAAPFQSIGPPPS